MLGDTIDYKCMNYEVAFCEVFNYLESLEIPIFLIGGNHDKERIDNLEYTYEGELLYIKDTFIRVRHPNPDPNGEKYSAILMGHDFGNNFEATPEEVPTYVKWMGDVFNQYFQENDMMLIGHTHQDVKITGNEYYSISQFSPVFNSYKYAAIEDDGNKFKVTFNDLDNSVLFTKL